MDLFTLASLSGLAKAVEWFLTDGEKGIGRIGAAIATGVLGNRADGLVCRVFGASGDYFNKIRTTDPNINHDLEWAARKAYLVATQEMARQAMVRMEANPAWKIWRPAVDRIRAGVKQDLDDQGKKLPVRVADVELWLLDENKQPAERMQRLRTAMEQNLRADIRERWTNGEVPTVIEDLLRTGWRIDTKRIKNVDRDWHGLIAIAFMEELKSNTRLAAIFQSKVLVELANREPALQPMASFARFQAELDKILVPLQAIEGSLGVLHGKVDAIAFDVGEVKAEVEKISGMLGWWAKLPRAVQAGFGLMLLVGVLWGATRLGKEVGCQVPALRAKMEQWKGWRENAPSGGAVAFGAVADGSGSASSCYGSRQGRCSGGMSGVQYGRLSTARCGGSASRVALFAAFRRRCLRIRWNGCVPCAGQNGRI